MKRSDKTPKSARHAGLLLTMAIVLPLSAFAFVSGTPDLRELPERAALFSAMLNMPEGSLALLKSRYAQQMDPAYYDAAESQVTPYVVPFEEDESEATPAPNRQPVPAPIPPAPKIQTASPSPAKDTSHPIPAAHRGQILQENMSGSGESLVRCGKGFLRNYTEVPAEKITEIMKRGLNLSLTNTGQPEVLIFHTHATESYEPYDSEQYDTRNHWRSTDNAQNMVAVGNALEKALRDAGIAVIHDKTQHDYPSYNGSYERSAVTVKRYLTQYPSIKIALDVHRDAILREEDLIVKPTVEVNGKKAAQLMIITGSDDGTMDIPHWEENLRFAAALQNAIEQDTPALTRPIFFCYRKYNMDLTAGSLLFEVGSNANTLEESIYTAELVGKSLAKLLQT